MFSRTFHSLCVERDAKFIMRLSLGGAPVHLSLRPMFPIFSKQESHGNLILVET